MTPPKSPSSLLERAADKLERLAYSAALSPWTAEPYVGLEYYRHRGMWQVSGPNWEVGEDSATPAMTPGDAAWVASMNPVVATPLVNWLRDSAECVRGELGQVTDSSTECAVAFARLILGEPVPGEDTP